MKTICDGKRKDSAEIKFDIKVEGFEPIHFDAYSFEGAIDALRAFRKKMGVSCPEGFDIKLGDTLKTVKETIPDDSHGWMYDKNGGLTRKEIVKLLNGYSQQRYLLYMAVLATVVALKQSGDNRLDRMADRLRDILEECK